jgi:hypothetical protein
MWCGIPYFYCVTNVVSAVFAYFDLFWYPIGLQVFFTMCKLLSLLTY